MQLWSVRKNREAIPAVTRLIEKGAPGVYLVVGVEPGDRIRWDQADGSGAQRPEIFIQVAAETDAARLAALRAVDEILAPVAERTFEILGGRLGEGREPFGFIDGTSDAGRAAAERLSASTSVHLLFLELEQDVSAFSALPEDERRAILGVDYDGNRLEPRARHADAHVVAQAPYASLVARRGFPFRHEGREGLAFIAFAADPSALAMAEQRFFGTGSSVAEPLSRFVRVRRRKTFVAPSLAAWLDRGPKPKEAVMEYGSGVGPTTVSYAIASETYGYVKRVLDLGAIEGALGEMKVSPEIDKLFQAIHEVLAGGEVEVKVVRRGSPDIVRDLNQRLAAGAREANEINKQAGYYVTLTV